LLREAPLGQRPIHPAFSVRVIARMQKVSDEGPNGSPKALEALVADVLALAGYLLPCREGVA
jgi:hypothetical protein